VRIQTPLRTRDEVPALTRPGHYVELCSVRTLDGSRCTGENGDFELWDTERGLRLRGVQRLSMPIRWCIASPDENTILTGDVMLTGEGRIDRDELIAGFTPTVVVWDAKSGSKKKVVRVPFAKSDPLWGRDWYALWLDKTRVLIVRTWQDVDNTARIPTQIQLVLVDTTAGTVLKVSQAFDSVGEYLTLSPDGKKAFITSGNSMRPRAIARNIDAKVHVVSTDSLEMLASWREPPDSNDKKEGIAHLVRWSPDSKTVMTARWGGEFGVNLWDANSGKLIRSYIGHSGNVLDVAQTSAGDKLLTASEDGTIRLWDIPTGKSLTVFPGHNAKVHRVIVMPGDKWAVSAADEPVAKVWDLMSGKLLFDLAGHDSPVGDLKVLSKTVVQATTVRGTTASWDCSTGKQLQVTLKPPDSRKVFGTCELTEEKGVFQMRILPRE
jgi:WD40 repeat protein